MPSTWHICAFHVADIFALSPLTRADWRAVAYFALPLVVLEEGLKLAGRLSITAD